MKRTLISFILAGILALSACGAAQPSLPSASPSPTPSPVPTAEPTPTPLPYLDPLSGEGCEMDLSDARPFAVMINNLDKAQPQCGVSEAEILYEIPAEGGITRMLALFSDVTDAGTLGSIRSIRPYYANAALAYDAILVHAGGSEASYTEMRAKAQEHLDGVLGEYGDGVFYRDEARKKFGFEHSMFASGDKLLSAARDEGFRMGHETGGYDYRLAFSGDASEQCSGDAEYVTLTFDGGKTTSFDYDEKSGLYTAYQYDGLYFDGNTGEGVTFSNILVLYATLWVTDEVGRLSVRLTGGGDGVFICGGGSAAITWERTGDTEPFSYALEDGAPLELGVGHSYIAVMSRRDTAVAYGRETG